MEDVIIGIKWTLLLKKKKKKKKFYELYEIFEDW